MEENRANPDELLKSIQDEERDKKRGHLKIFFGYAAGVGKTYAMLEAAHEAKAKGIDVVLGYIEPHARPDTAALVSGLEMIPTKSFDYQSIQLSELDLDAAITRNPQLILVDELAHTNAQKCRHAKRYQDVEELLKAGIDVYTTINVQHIESLNDMVASITGVMVKERIPDRIFDEADQVELVDIEPQELIERLSAGQVYRQTQAELAMNHFFSIDNLTALKEIALRRCADRVNKLQEVARTKKNDYYIDEHILVCLSPSPSNPKIIRNAARMAHGLNAKFTALFVETPQFMEIKEVDRDRLRANFKLAQQLKATIEIVYGSDVAYQIAEFARLSRVSKIVLGRNNVRRRHLFSKATLTEKLIGYAPNLDIYIIPDKEATATLPLRQRISFQRIETKDIAKSIGIILAATFIGMCFYEWGFSEANIITVYILGVLIIATVTSRRFFSIVSSIISVLVFNFFFTEPIYTFKAYDPGYPATFVIMFIAALITGSLAAKIKQNAKQSAQTAFRTKILFETNQLLQKSRDLNSIVSVTANQLTRLLDKDIVFYISKNKELMDPVVFLANKKEVPFEITTTHEQAVANWVMKNNKHAGATTNTLSDSKCFYLAIRVNENVYGVVGIVMNDTVLDAFENSIVLSILGECALAMENQKAAKEKQEAAILAKNEQLRANLLRSISHDLRTPLTSISGNAGILLAKETILDEAKRNDLIKDIYDDSLWLINLVENLLSVTRIEDGSMNLKMTIELMDEVISEALQHFNRSRIEHKLVFHSSDEFIFAKIDARLIVQVIINIVDNAIKYTPKDSTITISLSKVEKQVIVEIKDEGPGISDESKPHIFDMFYTDATKIADSRRSLGLGLALCKSIITVHNGEIKVSDNYPQGTIFSFTLPAEEVNIHE